MDEFSKINDIVQSIIEGDDDAVAILAEVEDHAAATQAMLAAAWEIATESDALLERLAELASDAELGCADMLAQLLEARAEVRVQWGADAGVRPDQRAITEEDIEAALDASGVEYRRGEHDGPNWSGECRDGQRDWLIYWQDAGVGPDDIGWAWRVSKEYDESSGGLDSLSEIPYILDGTAW